MLAKFKGVRYPVETALLLALCLFLPLLEAPKNILWLAYAATWVVNRARSGDFGGRWDLWDSLIAAWIGSGFVVAAFAGLDGDEWRGAGDLLRYASVLWLVKRSRYGVLEVRWVLGMLVASTVVGLAIGYVRLWTGIGKSGTLQLYSVGHVNHTAVYVAIVLGAWASWLFARWKAWSAGRRWVAFLVALLLLVSLVVTASRGAIGVGLVMLLALAAAWWPRWRLPLAVAGGTVVLTAAIAAASGAQFIWKHQRNVEAHNVLSYRDGIWLTALEAWERYPWFGVGMDNYGRITLDRVQDWHTSAGQPYDAADYVEAPHAHSLYLNTLAERGIVGSLALLAVLLAWAARLARFRPRRADSDHDALLWGAAGAAWLVTVGAGLANTTLHHEHGMLAMLLLGLWLSQSPARHTP